MVRELIQLYLKVWLYIFHTRYIDSWLGFIILFVQELCQTSTHALYLVVIFILIKWMKVPTRKRKEGMHWKRRYAEDEHQSEGYGTNLLQKQLLLNNSSRTILFVTTYRSSRLWVENNYFYIDFLHIVNHIRVVAKILQNLLA